MYLTTYRNFPYPSNLWSTVFQQEMSKEEIPDDWENTLDELFYAMGKQTRTEMVLHYFKNNLTLDAIGKIYGLTREAVRQNIVAAIEQLRRPAKRRIMRNGLLEHQSLKEKCLRDLAVNLSEGPDERLFALALSVSELNLDTRTYNCLRRNAINTIGELTEVSGPELLKIRGLGKHGIKEINTCLSQCGLKLRRDATKTNSKRTRKLDRKKNK